MGRVIAFSGTFGVGRFQAAQQKAEELARPGCPILPPVATSLPVPVNPQTLMDAFVSQVHWERANLNQYEILVSGRTCVDIVAHAYVAGFETLATDMLSLAAHHLPVYGEIHLKSIENNALNFEGCIPNKEKRFMRRMEDTLVSMYGRLREDGHMPVDFHLV